MCTFPESHKMALSLGAVRKDEEIGKGLAKEGKTGLALFMACLRDNPGNRRDGEK